MATKLAKVVRKKLAKLKGLVPTELYSTFSKSPTTVLVLENGSREVHRQKVTPDDDARYVIIDGWLVEETYPAAVERMQREDAKRRKAVAANSAAVRVPKFKTLLREMTDALGEPERFDRESPVRTTVWHFPAPRSSKQRAHWIDRARACGGSATHVTTHDELCVVAGNVSRLAVVLPWYHWSTAAAVRILDSIDRDAGLRITRVERNAFELVLDRVPKKLETHAAKLSTVFKVGSARSLAAALETQHCRCEYRCK